MSAAVILASGIANADTKGLQLPYAPSGQGGTDTIETSMGTRCSQSLNSSGPYVDIGVSLSEDDYSQERIGYGRLIIPLGKRPKRIDCSRLFELEIQRLQQEVQLLKMGIE